MFFLRHERGRVAAALEEGEGRKVAAGVGTTWEQEEPEAREMLAVDARFVGPLLVYNS
ncbi:MAG: hypothetical protein IT314_10110 [Anaerolineales bacterium]|nr:hypothetical protein [Anaerolineales bacterium]